MIQGIRWNENDHVDEVEFEELLRQLKRLIGDSPKPKVKLVRKSDSTNASSGSSVSLRKKLAKKLSKKLIQLIPFNLTGELYHLLINKRKKFIQFPDAYKDFRFTKITPDETYAIIIGIGNYKDGRVPKLNYARSDAKAFYDLLLNPAHVGLKQENVNCCWMKMPLYLT